MVAKCYRHASETGLWPSLRTREQVRTSRSMIANRQDVRWWHRASPLNVLRVPRRTDRTRGWSARRANQGLGPANTPRVEIGRRRECIARYAIVGTNLSMGNWITIPGTTGADTEAGTETAEVETIAADIKLAKSMYKYLTYKYWD